MAGSFFFYGRDDVVETESGGHFAKVLLPSFEFCLKTVSSTPLNSSGGPFEGYVAIATLLQVGPLAQSKKFSKLQDGLHDTNVY